MDYENTKEQAICCSITYLWVLTGTYRQRCNSIFIGDIVQIANEYGNEGSAYISELIIRFLVRLTKRKCDLEKPHKYWIL